METINSIKANTDILLKYADFIASYEDFLINSKNRVVNFWSDIKLWLIGKALYHSFFIFTKDKLEEQIVITALNYNFYSAKKDNFRKLIALQKSSYERIPVEKLSWGVRSVLIDFSKVFDELEIYVQQIEMVLDIENQKLDAYLKDNSQHEIIDFDAIPKPAQNWENVGSIESDETLEELLAALTK